MNLPVLIAIHPTHPDSLTRLAEALAALGGRRARLAVGSHVYEGRVVRPSRWRRQDEPEIMLPPGALDGRHPMAETLIAFRVEGGTLLACRRRWYEEDDLDCQRLATEPVRVEVSALGE